MLEKVKSLFADFPVKKIVVGGGIAGFLITLILILQPMWNKFSIVIKDKFNPPAPVMQPLPKVDYSLDRNWSTCIYRRLEAMPRGSDAIKQCDDAFSMKK